MRNTFGASSHSLPRLVCAALLVLCALPPVGAQTSNVVGWGDNGYGQLAHDIATTAYATPVFALTNGSMTAIAPGYAHTLALRQDGAVMAWGDNGSGQLGNGTNSGSSAPVQVVGPNGTGFLSGVKALAAGSEHSVALKSDGTVWAWGRNSEGELGDGTNSDSNTPVQVAGPNGVGVLTGIAAVSTEYDHTVALKSDGTIWTWGYNGYGALGDGTGVNSSTPVQVTGPNGIGHLTGIKAVAVGWLHTVALKQDGTVWAWGEGGYGELGDGAGATSLTPVQVAGPNGAGVLTGVIAVAAGSGYSLALKADGTVWAWGDNSAGQLGDGTNTSRLTPTQVIGPNGAGFLIGVSIIAAGYAHTAALKLDGTVWAWGNNGDGELGIGVGADRSTPTATLGIGGIGNMIGVTFLAAGSGDTFALLGPPVTVAGVVMLEGCVRPQQNITFQFRPADGSPPFTQTQTLAANGSFTFNAIPRGAYYVAIKGAIWLQKVATVNAMGGNASGVSVTLPAGDANNDNSVDSTDFGILIGAFGSDASVPGSGYDPTADFNCDGLVDSTDFGLLIGNFNKEGES